MRIRSPYDFHPYLMNFQEMGIDSENILSESNVLILSDSHCPKNRISALRSVTTVY